MKSTIKKYRGWALLAGMFIFSLHINAVFEGRDKSLEQYQSVRTEVEMTTNQVKAYGTNPSDEDEGGKPKGPSLGSEPITDSPWAILLLGCGAFCLYVLAGREKRAS